MGPNTVRVALLSVIALLCLGRPHGAGAQSMDYGALEQLFGESVTTSAIGTPQRARDVPAAVEIVTQDDIRRSGEIDIPGVLSHVTGVDVSRWTNLGADVSIRGNNSPLSPRLLVLINGRQVYLDDYGRTEWALLPVELAEIRQIEIIKGPNSALFGFNAAGGVINIITYNPLYDTVNRASLRFGTQRYQEGSVVATARAGEDVAVRLSAGGTRTDDFRGVRTVGRAYGLPEASTRDQFSADLHWRIDAGTEAELELSHSDDERLGETPVWTPGYFQQETSAARGRLIADTAIGVLTAQAYTNWTNTHVLFTGYPPTGFGTRLTVVSLQDVFQPAAGHTVRLSTEYRHSGMNTAPIPGGRISYDIASLSGMWNWNVTSGLALTAAARMDALWLHRGGDPFPGTGLDNALWSRRLVEPSYNVGAVWRGGPSDTLRLTAARGVQLPSLIELGGLQVGGDVFAASGNPQVNPTIVNNYELDWDHAVTSAGALARVAVFFQQTRDFASFVSPLNVRPTPGGFFLSTTDTVGDSDEVGAEFSLKGTFGDGFRWKLSYSPRFVSDAFREGANYANTGIDFERTTPRHVVDATLGWSRGAWEVDGLFRFQSSATGLFTTDAGSFSLARIGPTETFDARVAYRVGEHVTLSLSGQNVLFSSARQTVLGKVQTRVLGGLAVSF